MIAFWFILALIVITIIEVQHPTKEGKLLVLALAISVVYFLGLIPLPGFLH